MQVTFTRLSISSERFASSAALQYYETLPSLTDFTTYLLEKICPGLHETCKHKADALRSADYIDIDYDAISQSLVLSAFWNIPPLSGVWNEQVDTIEGSVQVEVGVLANEKPTQPEELSLGGFLAVIGEDSKTSMRYLQVFSPILLTFPEPTLFSFPSRHHLVPPGFGANYSTAFLKPTGLHPTLRLTLPSSINPPLPTCALHTYLNLPSALFLDKYQLSSPNYLTSKNLKSIRALSGETDLEAPIWTVVQWGSAVLLELAHPPSDSESASILDSSRPGSPWHADIPLHLRYLRANPGGQIPLSIAWPVVFWACPSDYGTKMNTNPFDRVNLGYDGLFGPRTMFYHLQAASGGKPLTEELQAPVLDLEGSKLKWVELGTVTIVILGSLWVCSKLLRVTMMMSSGGQKEDRQRKKQ